MGIAVRGDQRLWQFINSSIKLPPNNKTRTVSCTADSIHFTNSKGFFKMESCEFACGNDDIINIHDISCLAVKSGEKSIRTRNLRPWVSAYFHKRDELELRNIDYSPGGFSAKLTKITEIDAASGIYEMAFDQKVPKPKGYGFIIFNKRYYSRNIIIRNNKFHGNRGRGLLISGRDITVENCKFSNQQFGAIHIKVGFTLHAWCEGYETSNIVIRNNVFSKVNPLGRYINEYKPDIYISTYINVDPSNQKASYPVLNDILIDGNRFYDTTGAAIYIASAKNVFILNNTINNDLEHPNKYKYRGAIGACNVSSIYVYGNYWTGKYNYKAGLVYNAANVKNIHMSKNKKILCIR
jgi:parallel beta-helix repeat protein